MLTPALRKCTPTSVYLYYDRYGILIYVGVTATGITRNRQHNATKAWWPFVASQVVEHHPTREEALQRERDLILKFEPPFNKQHNHKFKQANRAYLSMAQSGASGFRLLDPVMSAPDSMASYAVDMTRVDKSIVDITVVDAPPSIMGDLVYDPSDRAVAIYNNQVVGRVWAVVKVVRNPTRIKHIRMFPSFKKMASFQRAHSGRRFTHHYSRSN